MEKRGKNSISIEYENEFSEVSICTCFQKALPVDLEATSSAKLFKDAETENDARDDQKASHCDPF